MLPISKNILFDLLFSFNEESESYNMNIVYIAMQCQQSSTWKQVQLAWLCLSDLSIAWKNLPGAKHPQLNISNYGNKSFSYKCKSWGFLDMDIICLIYFDLSDLFVWFILENEDHAKSSFTFGANHGYPSQCHQTQQTRNSIWTFKAVTGKSSHKNPSSLISLVSLCGLSTLTGGELGPWSPTDFLSNYLYLCESSTRQLSDIQNITLHTIPWRTANQA